MGWCGRSSGGSSSALWTEVPAHPGRPLAPGLTECSAAVCKAARREAAQAAVWQRLIGRGRQKT